MKQQLHVHKQQPQTETRHAILCLNQIIAKTLKPTSEKRFSS